MRQTKYGPAYDIGDTVSLEKWDKTEPPYKRMGVCTVTGTWSGVCESGVIVEVTAADGRTKALDSHWLVPAAGEPNEVKR